MKSLLKIIGVTSALAVSQMTFATAATPALPKGVGPVQSVTLAKVDPAKASKGQQLFQSKCTACHQLNQKLVGPALSGVTKRRAPEWILNMILNPAEMTQKDPTAKELLATYKVPMSSTGVTQDEAKLILEYLRQQDGQ
ncbi:MAG: cytochrome c [Deltaproteobacteria bacterium]|nr:cytochrome c [Deltaproteobacteria bacterium]